VSDEQPTGTDSDRGYPPTLMTAPRATPRRRARDLMGSGTGYMVVGTLVAAVGAYLFQLVAGRALGPTDFAPITVLWTIQFLAFTTVFMPIEQLTIRRLNAKEVAAAPTRLFTVAIAATTVVSVAFAIVTRDRLLEGRWVFVVITGALIVAYGLFALARGLLAGRRRFKEYGLAVLAESLLRLALAIVLLLAGFGTVGVAWTLVAGALVVFLWNPFSRERGSGVGPVEAGTGVALVGFVTATAAAQTLVAAGPLVVGALGASAAEVSVFFETFLLFRAPLTIAYSLVARVLPPFTRLVESGRLASLRTWTVRLTAGAAVLATIAYFTGHVIGPSLVEILLGAEFRPASDVAAYAAAGVVLATIALFLQQILIAMHDTTLLAVVWMAGIATAVAVIAITAGTASGRVGAGFLAGEATATAGLAIAVMARARRT
jgi:O-antigen/teichoic acid export membrane protein